MKRPGWDFRGRPLQSRAVWVNMGRPSRDRCKPHEWLPRFDDEGGIWRECWLCGRQERKL